MDFRTLVDLPVKQLKINHSHKIMMLGSCFAENIGRKLQENKFRCDINPYGVLYNPCSLASARAWPTTYSLLVFRCSSSR